MKKISVVLFMALVSISAFAENTLHIGISFPISPLTLTDWAEKDIDSSQSGVEFAFDYTHAANSGFTWKGFLDGGMVKSSDVKTLDGNDISGFDITLGAGFGASPIRNERMTLSVFGDLGIRYQYFDLGSFDVTGNYINTHFDGHMDNIMFFIGPEVSYTFRFNEHIGIFANFGIFYNIGSESYFLSGTGTETVWCDEFGDGAGIYGFSFVPKVGLSVTL